MAMPEAALGNAQRRGVNKGEIAWKIPLGVVDELKTTTTGTPNLGGSIVTAGGLYLLGDDRRPFPRIRCEDRRATLGCHHRATAHAHSYNLHGQKRPASSSL